MGWLELLALMKRVLPLLSRVAPMLETYIGARGATRGDAEALEKLSTDVSYLKHHSVAEAENRYAIQNTLDAQGRVLLKLSDDMTGLRAVDAEQAARLQSVERQLVAAARIGRIALTCIVVLLLACVGLLIALLLRH